METVGVRDLKNRLSAVLRRVTAGGTVTVTDRNRPVALIVPLARGSLAAAIGPLIEAGLVSWSGGKPRGSARPALVRGLSVAQSVVEDRR